MYNYCGWQNHNGNNSNTTPENPPSKLFCEGFIFECSYKKHDHIKEKQRAYKWCEICEIKVSSLLEHKTEKHETCSYCDYKIKSQKDKACNWQSALKYHIDSNHPEHGEKKFFCNVCPKGFIFKSVFSAHLRIHNKIQQKHMCEQCGQEFLSKNWLKEHIYR